MPRIPFPNVPNVPGVPQVLRRFPAGPPAILASAAGLASLVRAFTAQNNWGVFEHVDQTPTVSADGLTNITVTTRGNPVVTPDSFLNFDFNNERTVTTAPTQLGAFADYNRVANPFEVKLRMSKGGSVPDREKFLKQIDALDTTKLYDIFTPEKTYLSCNFIRIEVSRHGEKGAYWLSMVDVVFREIRTVTATYSKTTVTNPRATSAAQTQNNGTQQGIDTNATPPVSVTR